MAHLPLELVSRLPLYTSEWQPVFGTAQLPQLADRVSALRIVARRQLDVCHLGPVSRHVPCAGAHSFWQPHRPAAASCTAYLYAGGGAGGLGAFPGGKL